MTKATAAANLRQWKGVFMANPSRVHGGLMVEALPVIVLAEDGVSPESVGGAIRDSLEVSSRLKACDMGSEAVLLRELRARSWRELERKAKTVSITEEPNGICFTPLFAFDDPREGEYGMSGDLEVRRPLESSRAELGALALELLGGT